MRLRIRIVQSRILPTFILCMAIALVILVYFSSDFTEEFDKAFEMQIRQNPVDMNHRARQDDNEYIVPNIVHYVHYGVNQISFNWYVSIMSVIVNHKPWRIIIHCDCNENNPFTGKLWDRLQETGIPLILKSSKLPKYVFGRRLAHIWHATDVVRLRALMESGGIYLDNDVFVLNSLDKYRHYEFSLGWPTGENLGSQVLIAEKNATFLKLYYDSYHDYDGSKWYFNAGQLPTERYLTKNPRLVHSEATRFGVKWPDPIYILYNETRTLNDMQREYDTIHLSARHRHKYVDDAIVDFNEDNIKLYNRTFGILARSVLPWQ